MASVRTLFKPPMARSSTASPIITPMKDPMTARKTKRTTIPNAKPMESNEKAIPCTKYFAKTVHSNPYSPPM